MASFAAWDEAAQRFVLGPPLQGAQEIFPKQTHGQRHASSSTYWRWGLEAAQRWRERLGLAREERLDRVLRGLSALPVRDGTYLFAETAPDELRRAALGARSPRRHGVLSACCPDPASISETMRRTFDWICDALELPGHLGLGLPAAGDERGAARASPPAPSTRC